jgi:AraC-like DNA-binding protein
VIFPTGLHYGEIVYPPGGGFGPRLQISYQLVLIYRGCMTVWIDGEPMAVGANTTTLLLPGPEERFEFDRNGETHHAWVHLFLEDLPWPLKERLKAVVKVIELSEGMAELMRQLLALRTSQLPTSEELRRTVAAQMLWRYIGEAELLSTSAQSRVHSEAIERAQRYMQFRLHEPLTLPLIANALAISPAHLIRLFRSHLGQTPIEYLWRQRVKLGVDLLQETGLNVEQIAMRCGFKTSYHFSRRMKALTGLTPTQVRRQAHQR